MNERYMEFYLDVSEIANKLNEVLLSIKKAMYTKN